MTQVLSLQVQQVYYDAIANGIKTIEGRLAKDKYRTLKPGDLITFSNADGTQSLVKAVTAVHLYPTFQRAFREQDFKLATPNAKTLEDAIHIYEQFYPKSTQQEFGVAFIEFK